MAVITELIDVGLQLKQTGNLQGAIEHFRQLHTTYPDHARIMFELAVAWREFGVPEQALPLFREILTMPTGQGLPPKDMPRLYTQLGATLRTLGEMDESLAIINEGLRLHPSYRPLRAWRIFVLHSAGSHPEALLDAIELMLESLAPSRWDVFEDDIVAIARQMRAEIHGQDAPDDIEALEESRSSSKRSGKMSAIAKIIAATSKTADRSDANTKAEEADNPVEEAIDTKPAQITVTDHAIVEDDLEIEVQVKQPAQKKKPKSHKKPTAPQLGKKPVRINIASVGEESDAPANDDNEPPTDAGRFKIPVDDD